MILGENKINCKKCGVELNRLNLGERSGELIRYFKFFEKYNWTDGICNNCVKDHKDRKVKK